MNALQRKLKNARATYERLIRQERESEQEYIRQNGIVNPDGSVPASVDDIEDEDMYNRAMDEWFAGYVKAGKADRVDNAARNLRKAEEAMLDFVIETAPGSIKDTLRSGRTMVEYRRKMLDLGMRLKAC